MEADEHHKISDAVNPSFAEMTSSVLWSLLDAWKQARAGGGPIPYRSAIDPLDMAPELIPKVWVVELRDGQFFYRLAGQEIVRVFPNSSKKASLIDVVGAENAKIVYPKWRKTLDDRCGCFTIWLVYSDKQHFLGQRLRLPLRDNDGNVVILIGATDYKLQSQVGDGDAIRLDHMKEIYVPVADL